MEDRHATQYRRILTTHAGSLYRPPELLEMINARFRDEPVDAQKLAEELRLAVGEVVSKQAACGIDVVDDGELSKPSFADFVADRISGFEGENPDQVLPNRRLDIPSTTPVSLHPQGRDGRFVSGRWPGRTKRRCGPTSRTCGPPSPTPALPRRSSHRLRPASSRCGYRTRTTRVRRSISGPSPRLCARSTAPSSMPVSSCRSTRRTSDGLDRPVRRGTLRGLFEDAFHEERRLNDAPRGHS